MWGGAAARDSLARRGLLPPCDKSFHCRSGSGAFYFVIRARKGKKKHTQPDAFGFGFAWLFRPPSLTHGPDRLRPLLCADELERWMAIGYYARWGLFVLPENGVPDVILGMLPRPPECRGRPPFDRFTRSCPIQRLLSHLGSSFGLSKPPPAAQAASEDGDKEDQNHRRRAERACARMGAWFLHFLVGPRRL